MFFSEAFFEVSTPTFVVMFAIFALVVFGMILRLYWSSKKGKSATAVSSAAFGSIKSMRDKGLITEEEYKNIRHKAAQRELERVQNEDNSERDKLLMAEVEKNPLAARQFLGDMKPGPAPQAAPSGELEALLAKGAITREDYDRLKKTLNE